MGKISWILGAGMVAMLLGCNAAGNSQTTTSNASSRSVAAVGSLAPDFSLPSLNSKQSVTLNELLAKNQPIVLNAWASWCGPCQNETPDFVKLAKKYEGKVQFVGVNMTKSEMSQGDVSSFVNKYKVTYPVLLDVNGDFADAYSVYGYPNTFVILPSRKIVGVERQAVSAEQLDSIIQQAINQTNHG